MRRRGAHPRFGLAAQRNDIVNSDIKGNTVPNQTILVLAAALISFSASARTYAPHYQESIDYRNGEASIIFGKYPSVYISETARNQSSVTGSISYSFLASGGPANSYVPIDFTGRFALVFQGDHPGGGGRWSQASFSIGASDYIDLGNNIYRGDGLRSNTFCNGQLGAGGCSVTAGQSPASNYIQSGNSFMSQPTTPAQRVSLEYFPAPFSPPLTRRANPLVAWVCSRVLGPVAPSHQRHFWTRISKSTLLGQLAIPMQGSVYQLALGMR